MHNYCGQQYDNQINNTSENVGKCSAYSMLFSLGYCVSDGVNATRIDATYNVATMHFGNYPPSFKQYNCICMNNTGYAIFGHSCASSDEQVIRNAVFLNNRATDGVLMFWNSQTKFINSYFKNNSVNVFISYLSSSNELHFESCYHDGISVIASDLNPVGFYQIDVPEITICQMYNYENIYEFLKLRTKLCGNGVNVNPFIFALIIANS
jgi:hypothetical protein